jgi:hypothetical protein
MNTEYLLGLMNQLSIRRRLFHSEADFQLELASLFKESGHSVRLEKSFRLNTNFIENVKFELDIELDGEIAIELKYKTKKLSINVDGEQFLLTSHSAGNLGRFDAIDDARWVRELVNSGISTKGFTIFLTNDYDYWTNDASNTMARNFNIVQERVLSDGDSLAWHPIDPSAGSAGKSRINPYAPIPIHFNEMIRWHNYSDLNGIKNGNFRFIVINVNN